MGFQGAANRVVATRADWLGGRLIKLASAVVGLAVLLTVTLRPL